MGILNDISKKAQEYAGIAVDKAKDLAEVAASYSSRLMPCASPAAYTSSASTGVSA